MKLDILNSHNNKDENQNQKGLHRKNTPSFSQGKMALSPIPNGKVKFTQVKNEAHNCPVGNRKKCPCCAHKAAENAEARKTVYPFLRKKRVESHQDHSFCCVQQQQNNTEPEVIEEKNEGLIIEALTVQPAPVTVDDVFEKREPVVEEKIQEEPALMLAADQKPDKVKPKKQLSENERMELWRQIAEKIVQR